MTLHRPLQASAAHTVRTRAAQRAEPSHPHTPATTSVEALRLLQRRIGNRATAQLMAGTAHPTPRSESAEVSGTAGPRDLGSAAASPMARAVARVSSTPSHGVTIGRKILIDGNEVDLPGLIGRAPDPNVKLILANWGWSKVEHDFRSFDALVGALGTAMAQEKDAPALYRAANLAFLTQASGRLPTLYFISGTTSGRIRQQHGSGPAVISQSDKTDYFFTSQGSMSAFQAAARQARNARTAFTPDLATYGATTTPTAGAFHFEVTYSGGVPTKLHPSGGLVDVDVSAYDDPKIRKIYSQATGQST